MRDISKSTFFDEEIKGKLKKLEKWEKCIRFLPKSVYKELLTKDLKDLPDKDLSEIISKALQVHDLIKLLKNDDKLKSMFALTSYMYQRNNIHENPTRQKKLTTYSVMYLGNQPVGTTPFSRYGDNEIRFNNSTFILSQILVVISSLALCIASASDKLGSEGRKCYRITSRSGATMYFVIGRTKLFSTEVFDEALVISVLINEQNGSSADNGLQIAYTLVFPNDCRMFLHVPIYQDGYVYRIDRKNNNTFQVVPLEKHNMAVMPNSSEWSGFDVR